MGFPVRIAQVSNRDCLITNGVWKDGISRFKNNDHEQNNLIINIECLILHYFKLDFVLFKIETFRSGRV